MKALLLDESYNLKIIDTPVPSIRNNEVLVRIKAAGICGSDVHGVDGSTGRRIPPLIMGHEAAGVIEKMGSEVKHYKIGDRVTFDSTIYCGECPYCLKGEINFCEQRKVLGVACEEYSRQGVFAEYAALPARILYKLPIDFDFTMGAMIEPLSIAMHAVNISPKDLGGTALVIGAGVIGLLTLEVLLAAGYSRVYIADINEKRLKTAKELGATEIIYSKEENIADTIQQLTKQKGVDCAIDAVGLETTVNNAIYSLKKGGTATIIGNFAPKIELPLQYLVSHQICLQGSNASAGEYPLCIEMIHSNLINIKRLISKVAPLREGAKWFQRLHEKPDNLYKIILEP